MTSSDTGFVIKCQFGNFYTGMGTQFDKLRFAKIYHRPEYVKQAINKIHKQYPDFTLTVSKVLIVEEIENVDFNN